MNEVEDVQPGHIYQPGNKKEVRLVYRILSGPYCGRHQKSFSLTKWGPAGAWAAAREAKAFMLDTGRLPPFFASPYSRSRLTNASANGVSRGYLGEGGGGPGSSDSEDIANPPVTSREASGASSPAVRVAGPKRTQRRARRPPSAASQQLPLSSAAAAAVSPVSPDLGSAACALEALLSAKSSKAAPLFPRLPRGADLLTDATSLQLLALGSQQEQEQRCSTATAAAAASGNPLGAASGASPFTSRPQTVLDLAALSLLPAGYPLNAEAQQQQQGTVKDTALLLQQMQQVGQLDLLRLLESGGAASGAELQQQQNPCSVDAAAARCMQQGAGKERQQQQQQQWEYDRVHAQLLNLPLKRGFPLECQETLVGGSGSPGIPNGAARETLPPVSALSSVCAMSSSPSLELSGLVSETNNVAEVRPRRHASEVLPRDRAAEAGGISFHKDKELLLNFLATADNVQRHRQQQQQQQQQQKQQQQKHPPEDVINTLSSLVTLLESMRKKEASEQPWAMKQNNQQQQQQQQQQTPERDPISAAAFLQQHQRQQLKQQQAASWPASSSSGIDPTSIDTNDKSFSCSLLRFLQRHPGEGETAAVAPAFAATRTPECFPEPGSFVDTKLTDPGGCGARLGEAESRSSGSSNASTGSSSPKAAVAKVSRLPSDASASPATESGASPRAEPAAGPSDVFVNRRKGGQGFKSEQQQQQLLLSQRRDAAGASSEDGCIRRGSLDPAAAAMEAGLVDRDGW